MSARTPQRTTYYGDPSMYIRPLKQLSPSNKGVISSSSRPGDTRSTKRLQGVSDSSSEYGPVTIDSNSQELTSYFPTESKVHEPLITNDKRLFTGNGCSGYQPSLRIPYYQKENSNLAFNQQGFLRKNSHSNSGTRFSYRQSQPETDDTLDFSPIHSQIMSYEANNSSFFKLQSEPANLKINPPVSVNQRYLKTQNENQKRTQNKDNLTNKNRDQPSLKRSKSQPRTNLLRIEKAATDARKPEKNSFLLKRKILDSESECMSATFRAQTDNASAPTTDRSEKTKVSSLNTVSSHETRPQGLASYIQSSIQNATRCNAHNQLYNLFNPLMKQFACIECVYGQQSVCKKQHSFISLRNAFPNITEQNRSFKSETKENIKLLDDSFNNCQAGIKILKQNLDSLTCLVNKEFQLLHEEMVARKKLLIDTVRTVSFNRINELEAKAEDVSFLRGCFRDARDVDPFQNFELGIHFFAVYNLLKNSFKNFDYRTEIPCQDSLKIVEFPNRAETHVLLANYGRINSTQKASKSNLRRSASFTNASLNTAQTSARSRRGSSSSNSRTSSPGVRVIKVTSALNSKSCNIPKQGPFILNKLQRPSVNQPNNAFDPVEHPIANQPSHKAGKAIQIEDTSLNEHKTNQFLSPTHQERPGGRNLLYSVYEENRFEPRTPPQDLEFESKYQDSSMSNHSQHERITFQEKLVVIPNYETYTYKKPEIQTDDCGFFLEGSVITLNLPGLRTVLPPNFRSGQLLYRMSRDGPSSEIFHQKVEGISPLIVFIKANTNYVFGYYMPIAFKREDKYVSCNKSYLFSLKNPDLKAPMTFPVKPDKKFISLFQSSKSPCLGSTLHQKQDLWIQFDNPRDSCSNVGYAYSLPDSLDGTKVLAGSYTDWEVEEIEIFRVLF